MGISLLTITKKVCMLVYNFYFLILERNKGLMIFDVLEMTVEMNSVFYVG